MTNYIVAAVEGKDIEGVLRRREISNRFFHKWWKPEIEMNNCSSIGASCPTAA
jgi:hypothetical protein